MALTVPMQTAGNRPGNGYSITAAAKSPGGGVLKPMAAGTPSSVRARRVGKRAAARTANPTYLSGTPRTIITNNGVSLAMSNGSSV